MWKNIVGVFLSSFLMSQLPTNLNTYTETNIMIGTHADSLIAEAVVKGFGDQIDTALAWEAVKKDATVPPVGDGWIE